MAQPVSNFLIHDADGECPFFKAVACTYLPTPTNLVRLYNFEFARPLKFTMIELF